MSAAFEIKGLPTEFKVDDSTWEIEGYATAFGNVDHGGDRMLKGFFAESIKSKHPKGLIKTLWNHDMDTPIGQPTLLEEDDRGLRIRSTIAKTTKGRDVMELIKAGVITTMSVGYSVTEERSIEEEGVPIRELVKGELWEISPVTFAMNDQTSVEAVKAARGLWAQAKAGRVLSKSNMGRLLSAIESLQAIYDAANRDDDTTTEDGEGGEAKAAAHPKPPVSPEAKSALCELADTLKALGQFAQERV